MVGDLFCWVGGETLAGETVGSTVVAVPAVSAGTRVTLPPKSGWASDESVIVACDAGMGMIFTSVESYGMAKVINDETACTGDAIVEAEKAIVDAVWASLYVSIAAENIVIPSKTTIVVAGCLPAGAVLLVYVSCIVTVVKAEGMCLVDGLWLRVVSRGLRLVWWCLCLLRLRVVSITGSRFLLGRLSSLNGGRRR